jgi:DNA-binding response OmpR family regulator
MNQTTWQRALVGADRPFGPRLGTRGERHPYRQLDSPVIGPRGQLTFRDHTVFLSERNAMLASVLVYHFDSAVSDVELLDRVWPDGTTRWTLLHHLHQLQRRMARLGLSIVEVSERSHALRPVSGA